MLLWGETDLRAYVLHILLSFPLTHLDHSVYHMRLFVLVRALRSALGDETCPYS